MKKKPQKMDKKLVAAKQSHESEVKYIAKTYHIPIHVVRKVCKEQGRSRKKVYAALRLIGYVIRTRVYRCPEL